MKVSWERLYTTSKVWQVRYFASHSKKGWLHHSPFVMTKLTTLSGETKDWTYLHTYKLYINNSHQAIWRENRHGYLSADIICFEKRAVFRERSLRKTVSYEEQIMSKDKYPSIFSRQMEPIVFIIVQIIFATGTVLKIGEYLTIRLRARVFYEQIVNEAQPSWLSLVENEGE